MEQPRPALTGEIVTTPSRALDAPQRDPMLEDEGLFDDAIEGRRVEADESYYSLIQGYVDDLRAIMRQALGGMLWTKQLWTNQYYRFTANEWLEGDPAQPPPPPSRKFLRSNKVRFSKPCATIHSQQDCIPLAVVDPAFAMKELDLPAEVLGRGVKASMYQNHASKLSGEAIWTACPSSADATRAHHLDSCGRIMPCHARGARHLALFGSHACRTRVFDPYI